MSETAADLKRDIEARRTFAIISHPDAGKTTITEKLLLLGNAIQVAGSVKGKRGPHATSDWMSLEQERGISVTSSVMQFPYRDRTVHLLRNLLLQLCSLYFRLDQVYRGLSRVHLIVVYKYLHI